MDAAGLLLPDALEDALGAGALDAHRNSRVRRFKRLRELFGEIDVERRVERELSFAACRLDQAGVDRGSRRRRGFRWCGVDKGERCRPFEYIAPGELPLAQEPLPSSSQPSYQPFSAAARLSA